MANNSEEYLMGYVLALKIAVGTLALRHVAQCADPGSEIAKLNDLAHQGLLNENLLSRDAQRADRIRDVAEQALDDIFGSIHQNPS